MKKTKPSFVSVDEDCAKLTATELKDKYLSEYRAWSNHKYKQKQKGEPVHSSYEKFTNFLKDVGPKPFSSASLDRINNDDPEYAPGKVRWASKTTQTRNRSNTVKITENGQEYTAAEIAEITGVNIATIRNRISRGWPFEEIKRGRRNSGAQNKSTRGPRGEEYALAEEYWPWLNADQAFEWEDRYNHTYPNKSRFYFFEDEIVREYHDADYAIKDELPILKAKRDGQLKSYDIQIHLDYRKSTVPLEKISDKRMLDLWEKKERSLLALKRLEKFRKSKGKFHQKPRWDNQDEY